LRYSTSKPTQKKASIKKTLQSEFPFFSSSMYKNVHPFIKKKIPGKEISKNSLESLKEDPPFP